MFGLFGHKKRIDTLREDVQESFNHVKRDFGKVSEWIKHLDDKHGNHDKDLTLIKEQLLTIQGDLLDLKEAISFFGPQVTAKVSKQAPHPTNKQTNNYAVQTPVQTPVQTDILNNLTIMERGIVWALFNADMNLSYEDLAAVQGKDKSTIRGQINAIRQKIPGVLEEVREPNGKKRLYIPEKIKAEIVKSVKVKVKTQKNQKK